MCTVVHSPSPPNYLPYADDEWIFNLKSTRFLHPYLPVSALLYIDFSLPAAAIQGLQNDLFRGF